MMGFGSRTIPRPTDRCMFKECNDEVWDDCCVTVILQVFQHGTCTIQLRLCRLHYDLLRVDDPVSYSIGRP